MCKEIKKRENEQLEEVSDLGLNERTEGKVKEEKREKRSNTTETGIMKR